MSEYGISFRHMKMILMWSEYPLLAVRALELIQVMHSGCCFKEHIVAFSCDSQFWDFIVYPQGKGLVAIGAVSCPLLMVMLEPCTR